MLSEHLKKLIIIGNNFFLKKKKKKISFENLILKN